MVLESTQDLALKILPLSMEQCPVDDLQSLAFPSATFAHSEADEGFFGKLVLSEGKWSDVVVLENVGLKSFEILSLHKKLGKLRFD